MKKLIMYGFMILGIFTVLFLMSGCPDMNADVGPVDEQDIVEKGIPAGITNTGVTGYVMIKGRVSNPPNLYIDVLPKEVTMTVGKTYIFKVANPPVPGYYRFSNYTNDFKGLNGGSDWIALQPKHCGNDLTLAVTTPSINGYIYTYYFRTFQAEYNIKKPGIRLPAGPFIKGKSYKFYVTNMDSRAYYDITSTSGFQGVACGYENGVFWEAFLAVSTGWHCVTAVAQSRECHWQKVNSSNYCVYINQ